MLGGPTLCSFCLSEREKWSAIHEKGRGSVAGQARLNPLWPGSHAALKWHQKRDLWTTKVPRDHYLQKKKKKGKKLQTTNPQSPGSDATLITLLSCLKIRRVKMSVLHHPVDDRERHTVFLHPVHRINVIDVLLHGYVKALHFCRCSLRLCPPWTYGLGKV